MTRELSGGNATPPGMTGETAGDHGVGATSFLAGTWVRTTILVHDQPRRRMYRLGATSIPISRAIGQSWRFEKRPEVVQVRWTLAIDPAASFSLLPFLQTAIGAVWRRGMRDLGREDGVSG